LRIVDLATFGSRADLDAPQRETVAGAESLQVGPEPGAASLFFHARLPQMEDFFR
jgi:hypothetical protein